MKAVLVSAMLLSLSFPSYAARHGRSPNAMEAKLRQAAMDFLRNKPLAGGIKITASDVMISVTARRGPVQAVARFELPKATRPGALKLLEFSHVNLKTKVITNRRPNYFPAEVIIAEDTVGGRPGATVSVRHPGSTAAAARLRFEVQADGYTISERNLTTGREFLQQRSGLLGPIRKLDSLKAAETHIWDVRNDLKHVGLRSYLGYQLK